MKEQCQQLIHQHSVVTHHRDFVQQTIQHTLLDIPGPPSAPNPSGTMSTTSAWAVCFVQSVVYPAHMTVQLGCGTESNGCMHPISVHLPRITQLKFQSRTAAPPYPYDKLPPKTGGAQHSRAPITRLHECTCNTYGFVKTTKTCDMTTVALT